MRVIRFLIFVVIAKFSIFSFAENHNASVDASFSSIEDLKKYRLISIEDFLNINADFRDNKKILLSLCEMKNNTMAAGNFSYFLDEIISIINIDKEVFKSNSYVNAKCFRNNFLVEAMESNLESLKEFMAYGFDYNRPVPWEDKVGTFLDIAVYNFKHSTQGKDKAHWMTAIQILKKGKAKSCKDLELKCSIDY